MQELKTVESILAEVQGVLGGREKNYDHPDPNFARIRDLWQVALADKLKPGASITKRDVAMLMVLIKIARDIHTFKDDNWLDTVGYAVCALRLTRDDEGSAS